MQRGAAGVLAGHVGFAGVLVGLLAGHVGFAGVLAALGHASHEEAAGLEAPASVLACHLDLLLLFFNEAAGTLCSSCCLWEGEE